MITFVCFKWKSSDKYKTYFTSNHVNILYASVKRNFTLPFQFVCVTDDSRDLKPGIISVPLWDRPILPFEMDPYRPNCYTRLKLFSQNAGFLEKDGSLLGERPERIICLDLDLVITGDITALCSIPGEFVGWNKQYVRYQGAFFMLKPGTRSHVWEEFIRDPGSVRKRAEDAGFYGTDQGAMSLLLGPNERTVGKSEGIYHFAKDLRWEKRLPADCKIAIFHGSWSPWHPDMYNNYAWIREHWTENFVPNTTGEGKVTVNQATRRPRVQRI